MARINPTDTIITVWDDIAKYLCFTELSKMAKVSKQFKERTVLGGGRHDSDFSSAMIMPPFMVPCYRSYHRFR